MSKKTARVEAGEESHRIEVHALEVLRRDHDRIRSILREYEKIAETHFERKRNVSEKLFHETELHTRVEREILYPALEAGTDREGRKLILEALEQHRLIEALIEDLRRLDTQDEHFDPRMRLLFHNLLHHLEEEEGEVFPEAEVILGDEILRVGGDLQVRRERLVHLG